jgi:hypothetical protein
MLCSWHGSFRTLHRDRVLTQTLKPPASFSRGGMFFHSLNLFCARILAVATHRAGVDAPTEQSRRDGTACSPARECRVAYGLEASPGGTAQPG